MRRTISIDGAACDHLIWRKRTTTKRRTTPTVNISHRDGSGIRRTDATPGFRAAGCSIARSDGAFIRLHFSMGDRSLGLASDMATRTATDTDITAAATTIASGRVIVRGATALCAAGQFTLLLGSVADSAVVQCTAAQCMAVALVVEDSTVAASEVEATANFEM